MTSNLFKKSNCGCLFYDRTRTDQAFLCKDCEHKQEIKKAREDEQFKLIHLAATNRCLVCKVTLERKDEMGVCNKHYWEHITKIQKKLKSGEQKQ